MQELFEVSHQRYGLGVNKKGEKTRWLERNSILGLFLDAAAAHDYFERVILPKDDGTSEHEKTFRVSTYRLFDTADEALQTVMPI